MVQKKIFITYARENIDRIVELSQILIGGGYNVWFDKELTPGQNWKEELTKAIESCDVYFYTITKAVLASEWCEWEYVTAVKFEKVIIPVLLENDVKPPAALRELQFCNFTRGATGLETARLLYALQLTQRIAESKVSSITSEPKGAPSRVSATWLDEFGNWYGGIGIKKIAPVDETEVTIDKFIANRVMGGVLSVSGRLVITNQRLLFEINKFNIWGGSGISIPIKDIVSLTTTSVMFIPIGLKVQCQSGEEYTFSLYGREKLIRIINEQKGK
jgi:hypothetical protein